MSKYISLEEMREAYIQQGWMGSTTKAFYNLSIEEKLNPDVFEACCNKYYFGDPAIILCGPEVFKHRDLMLIAAKNGLGDCANFIPSYYFNDEKFCLALIKHSNVSVMRKISKHFRSSPAFVLKAINIKPDFYKYAIGDAKNDRDVIYKLAKVCPDMLVIFFEQKRRNDNILKDNEILFSLAENAPNLIMDYYPKEVLNDKKLLEKICKPSDIKVCKKRIKQFPQLLSCVDESIWGDDKKLVLHSVKQLPDKIYSKLPSIYKNDKDIFLVALKNSCDTLLKYTSDDIKNDPILVLKAVKSNPYNIIYASNALKDDKTIVMASFQEDTEEILQYASDRLRADYEIVFRAVKVDALNLQYASDELKDNEDIVRRALKSYGGVLEDASERLQTDADMIALANQYL